MLLSSLDTELLPEPPFSWTRSRLTVQVRSYFSCMPLCSILHARVIFSQSVVCVRVCVLISNFLPHTILFIHFSPLIPSCLIIPSSLSSSSLCSPASCLSPSSSFCFHFSSSSFSSPPLLCLYPRKWWSGSSCALPVLMPSWAHCQIPCTNALHPLSAVASLQNTITSTALPAPPPPSPASLTGSCQLFHQAPPTPRSLQSYASHALSCSRWIPCFPSIPAPSVCAHTHTVCWFYWTVCLLRAQSLLWFGSHQCTCGTWVLCVWMGFYKSANYWLTCYFIIPSCLINGLVQFKLKV